MSSITYSVKLRYIPMVFFCFCLLYPACSGTYINTIRATDVTRYAWHSHTILAGIKIELHDSSYKILMKLLETRSFPVFAEAHMKPYRPIRTHADRIAHDSESCQGMSITQALYRVVFVKESLMKSIPHFQKGSKTFLSVNHFSNEVHA